MHPCSEQLLVCRTAVQLYKCALLLVRSMCVAHEQHVNYHAVVQPYEWNRSRNESGSKDWHAAMRLKHITLAHRRARCTVRRDPRWCALLLHGLPLQVRRLQAVGQRSNTNSSSNAMRTRYVNSCVDVPTLSSAAEANNLCVCVLKFTIKINASIYTCFELMTHIARHPYDCCAGAVVNPLSTFGTAQLEDIQA
jgi:hypothetical protein